MLGSVVGGEPVGRIITLDCMEETKSATSGSASSDTSLLLKQQPQLQQQQPPQLLKKKRISGAEQKRRKKARQAALACQSGPSTSSGAAVKDPAFKAASKTVTPAVPSTSSSGLSKDNPRGSKRARSTGSSGTPPGHPKKKTGMGRGTPQPVKSYSSIAASHLRVAVIDLQSPQGKLTQAQADKVQAGLQGFLEDFLENQQPDQKSPTFWGWKYSGEILRIHCENDHSLEWLKTAVAACPAPWEGARLSVIPADQLPKLTKAALWIPGTPVDTRVAIARLAKQNPGLNVGEWCVFHDAIKEQPPGRLIVFGVGKDVVTKLSAVKGKLHYLFTALTVRLQTGSSATSTTPVGPTPQSSTSTAMEASVSVSDVPEPTHVADSGASGARTTQPSDPDLDLDATLTSGEDSNQDTVLMDVISESDSDRGGQ